MSDTSVNPNTLGGLVNAILNLVRGQSQANQYLSKIVSNGVAVLPSYPTYTVATLPAATKGAVAFVSDSNATLAAGLGNIVVGGGADFTPVFADGTNWRIG